MDTLGLVALVALYCSGLASNILVRASRVAKIL